MKTKKAAVLAICLFATKLALADSVVTYVESAVAKRASASYLQADATDNAYVYVTAQLDNPAGAQCVEPAGTDALGSLFIKSNLDLAITVQPLGFFGVDQKKEVPIASYNFSNDAKYCKSSWRQAVVIVPPTPFGVPPPGANSTNGVSLVVQFRSPDYVLTSAIPKINRFGTGLVCANATASRGTMAAISARRLNRY